MGINKLNKNDAQETWCYHIYYLDLIKSSALCVKEQYICDISQTEYDLSSLSGGEEGGEGVAHER